MICFKTCSMRNFVSVGDNPLTLELDRNPTTLVTGRNGSGKSVLVSDSLTFGLFGKSYRGINKPALINTINQRDCVVEVVFTKGPDTFKVIRGMKPTRLEVYKNDAPLNEEAAVRDTQSYIENDILGFDYNSFIRVCVMSTMNYTPFMQLSAFERRSLVENMLSLKAFSEMNKIHKANASTLKERIQALQSDLQVKRTQYEEKNRTFNLLQQIDDDRARALKEHLRGLAEKLEFQDGVILKLETQIADQTQFDFPAQIKQLKVDIQSTQRELREREVEVSMSKKKIEFFNNHTECEQCNQAIDQINAEQTVNKYCEIVRVNSESAVVLKGTVVKLGEKLDEVVAKNSFVGELEADLTYAKRSRAVLAVDIRKKLDELETASNASNESETIRDEVSQIKGQLKYIAGKFEEASDNRDIANIATELLKDTGIKSSIIKQYIPLLVGYVNHYLEQLNISIRFSLDENFNESITTRYANEYSYQNLSMGERSRLDLALAFAWRQIAKLKGSVYCNILILDEILDAGLDINGTEDALSILEDVCQDTSVFIISHKANLDEKVRSVIRLEKINGFTKVMN